MLEQSLQKAETRLSVEAYNRQSKVPRRMWGEDLWEIKTFKSSHI